MLQKALALDPGDAAANFNLGLLKAEQGDLRGAEERLRASLKKDPTLAAAAYNLAVIVSKDRMPEAIEWCRKAREANPAEPKYAYTLAFFLYQAGRLEAATSVLEDVVNRWAAYVDGYVLLASIWESRREFERAGAVYRRALSIEGIAPRAREMLTAKLAALGSAKTR